MKIPIVTIVGKPNVGKSMLFNRMARSRMAITSDEAGTTRDRIFYKIAHPEMDFFIVDTGGLEFEKGPSDSLEDNVQKQTRLAMEESDLILFVVNGKQEFSSDDFMAAEFLRRSSNKKPVILIANKCDNPADESFFAHMYELGLGKPIPTSALHNTGIDIITEEIISALKERNFLTKDSKEYKESSDFEKDCMNIALAGRTNVGKSSVINAMLNREKLIVSDIHGTTRDSTDTLIRHKGKYYNFIDTAGMRRRGKIGTGIEHYSVLRTLFSIEKSDISLLVIDSSREVAHQDQQIANTILKAGKGIVMLANKWDINMYKDLPQEKRGDAYISYLRDKFQFLPWAPLIFTSAVSKKNLSNIFEQIETVADERGKRISTARLNSFVKRITEDHKPTGTKKISPKLFYATQVDVNPPHFVFFVNKKKYFHFSYIRYLENRMREKFGFTGTPIVIEFREKEKRFSE